MQLIIQAKNIEGSIKNTITPSLQAHISQTLQPILDRADAISATLYIQGYQSKGGLCVRVSVEARFDGVENLMHLCESGKAKKLDQVITVLSSKLDREVKEMKRKISATKKKQERRDLLPDKSMSDGFFTYERPTRSPAFARM